MRVRILATVLAALLLVPIGACTGDDDEARSGARKEATAAKARTAVQMKVAKVEVVDGGGGLRKLSKRTRAQMVKTLRQYVQRASVTPLVKGTKAEKLLPLFTSTAASSVRRNRGKLVDDGLPKIALGPGSKASVRLVVLSTPGDPFDLVTATLAVTLGGGTEDGRRVKVKRTGDLTLIRERGAWRIDSYDLKAVRDVYTRTPDGEKKPAGKEPAEKKGDRKKDSKKPPATKEKSG